ncbi:hypothetical protein PIB30_063526 [Stylosanthes scabra]|uniref:Uncharacterized protein n=1 Tax=Stylosanthes scabra TaxID=79078 RepID=A0ABU6ZK49_9FABA|nr:hypothetical protein [Stylosanthes scabra]
MLAMDFSASFRLENCTESVQSMLAPIEVDKMDGQCWYHSTTIDFLATIGTPGIAFGAETSYSTAIGKLTKYNASVILADKGDST